MEQEIAVLQDTYNCVAKSLQEAKIARAETAESNCGTARPTHYSCGAKQKAQCGSSWDLGAFLGRTFGLRGPLFPGKLKGPAWRGARPATPRTPPRLKRENALAS